MNPPASSATFLAVAGDPPAGLRDRMRRGHAPDPAALDGFEYRGVNTARWARLLGMDRFVKGFAGERGYNRRVRRGPRTDPWLPTDGHEPEPFAFFSVEPVDAAAKDNRYLDSLLLDYGRFATGPFDPAGNIRDYLVGLDASADLLLGRAFVALGPARVQATYFVLERLRPAPAGAADALDR